jgi:uncharacterized repeat protein (TIGR01451 family)/uncharacterized repeat protein (TIGR02543 family)
MITVTLAGDTVVTATFTQDAYTLDVTIVGEGAVTVNPDQDVYHYGDVITLTAIPDPGWAFDGWSGDARGRNATTRVTIQGDTVVTATFIPLPALVVVKTVTPTADLDLGDVVTYSVTLVNNGDGTAMGIVLNDTLPSGVVFGAFVANAGDAEEDGGVITWTGDLATGASLTIFFTATVKDDAELYNSAITNTVTFSSSNAGSGQDEATFLVKPLYRIFMPFIVRN